MLRVVIILVLTLLSSSSWAAVYYVNAVNGIDTNDGLSPASAWQTLAQAQSQITSGLSPGDQVLFERGDVWLGGLTYPTGHNGTSASPIVIGNYGSGNLPVFDGGGSSTTCVSASGSDSGTTPPFAYITIDGLECQNFTQYGVYFHNNATPNNGDGMPGIVVRNTSLHNNGPGAYIGASGAFDDGNNRNQLMFWDEELHADGTILNDNTVQLCGGHDCIHLQGDSGSPTVSGNTCANWQHNCIDVEQSTGVLEQLNTVYGGTTGAAFYYQNPSGMISNPTVAIQLNVVYNSSKGIQCEASGGGLGTTRCNIYYNTIDVSSNAIVSVTTSTQLAFDVRGNIFDTVTPLFVCNAYNINTCGQVITWDYNDDGGSSGPPSSTLVVQGQHDLVGKDPLYSNATFGDFSLLPASPCIDAASIGLISTHDDMGALELVGQPVPPGRYAIKLF